MFRKIEILSKMKVFKYVVNFTLRRPFTWSWKFKKGENISYVPYGIESVGLCMWDCRHHKINFCQNYIYPIGSEITLFWTYEAYLFSKNAIKVFLLGQNFRASENKVQIGHYDKYEFMSKNRFNWLYSQLFLSVRQLHPNVGHATVKKLTAKSATPHVKEDCRSDFTDTILTLRFTWFFFSTSKSFESWPKQSSNRNLSTRMRPARVYRDSWQNYLSSCLSFMSEVILAKQAPFVHIKVYYFIHIIEVKLRSLWRVVSVKTI